MSSLTARLALAAALLGGCVRFEDHEMGPCWALPCGECVGNPVCAWDTSDNICRQAQQVPSGHGSHRAPARCPSDPRAASSDAGAVADASDGRAR